MIFLVDLRPYVIVWDVHHPGLKHAESSLGRRKIE